MHIPDGRHVAIKIFRRINDDTGIDEFSILRRLAARTQGSAAKACPTSLPRGFVLVYEPLCFTPCLVQELALGDMSVVLTGGDNPSPGGGAGAETERSERLHGLQLSPQELKSCYTELTMPEKISILHQVCIALNHAHHCGVAHRDVKLTNIVVSKARDARIRACLIDWGLSTRFDDSSTARKKLSSVGTPGFRDPLVALGDCVGAGALAAVTKTILPASDIWALGIVALMLLLDLPRLPGLAAKNVSTREITKRTVRRVTGPANLKQFLAGLVGRRCVEQSQAIHKLASRKLPSIGNFVSEDDVKSATDILAALSKFSDLVCSYAFLSMGVAHLSAPKTIASAVASNTWPPESGGWVATLQDAQTKLVASGAFLTCAENLTTGARAAVGNVDRHKNAIPVQQIGEVLLSIVRLFGSTTLVSPTDLPRSVSSAVYKVHMPKLLRCLADLLTRGAKKRIAQAQKFEMSMHSPPATKRRTHAGSLTSYYHFVVTAQELTVNCIKLCERVPAQSSKLQVALEDFKALAQSLQPIEKMLSNMLQISGGSPPLKTFQDFVQKEADSLAFFQKQLDQLFVTTETLQALRQHQGVAADSLPFNMNCRAPIGFTLKIYRDVQFFGQKSTTFNIPHSSKVMNKSSTILVTEILEKLSPDSCPRGCLNNQGTKNVCGS